MLVSFCTYFFQRVHVCVCTWGKGGIWCCPLKSRKYMCGSCQVGCVCFAQNQEEHTFDGFQGRSDHSENTFPPETCQNKWATLWQITQSDNFGLHCHLHSAPTITARWGAEFRLTWKVFSPQLQVYGGSGGSKDDTNRGGHCQPQFTTKVITWLFNSSIHREPTCPPWARTLTDCNSLKIVVIY